MGTLGTTGLTNHVMPSMTLGSGGVGGAITGDNITVYHMYNTNRLAYETKPPPAAAMLPGSTDDPIQNRHNGAHVPAGEPALDSARIDDIVRRVLEELKK